MQTIFLIFKKFYLRKLQPGNTGKSGRMEKQMNKQTKSSWYDGVQQNGKATTAEIHKPIGQQPWKSLL